ncbi:MAG: major capsid protein [Pontibacterium sp.]
MASLDAFNSDAFSVSTLTAAINNNPMPKTVLGDKGLFQSAGLVSPRFNIEHSNGTLSLVPASERGASGVTIGRDKRTKVPFNTLHLQKDDTILADEIMGMLAFGSENQVENLSAYVNQIAMKGANDIAATWEHQRLGAIKGSVLDADGSTELLDINAAFGWTQKTATGFAWNTASTKIGSKIDALVDSIANALQGRFFTGVRMLMNPTDYTTLTNHSEFQKLVERESMGRDLRNSYNEITVRGVTFEKYFGQMDGVAAIAVGEAWAFPEGVSDLFIARFAPADYNETVGTMGVPLYAKQWAVEGDKGIKLEVQSNPLFLVTQNVVHKVTNA